MKVVINKCYGGFSLSPLAVKRLADLQGRECYFFKTEGYNTPYIPVGPTDGKGLFTTAFDIPNPNDNIYVDYDTSTVKERDKANREYIAHHVTDRPDNRADPLLIQVIEELGKKADGALAKLKIVEIPDGIEYEIEEYDGVEWIAEKHRTWD